MTNILEEIPPSTQYFVKRIRFCAKALAYGATTNMWTPEFVVTYSVHGDETWEVVGHTRYRPNLANYLDTLWSKQQPHMYFLEAFGYVRHVKDINRKGQFGQDELFGRIFILTMKAFEILETPFEDPKVFISYKRDEGTALALLVLARLQARGVENPYIDMRLEGGDYWEKELEQTIKLANTFICILSPASLQSEIILKEIAWASQNKNMKYIFLTRSDWNNDIIYPDKYLDEIVHGSPHHTVKQFIQLVNWVIITDKTARGYDSAMVQLLSGLGYAPR
jgi:hypothetical protein